MKKKKIEKLQIAPTKKNGFIATVQTLDSILVMNIYRDLKLLGRYCMDTETSEFAQWVADKNIWNGCKLASLLGYEPPYWYYSIWSHTDLKFNSAEEEQLVVDMLSKGQRYVEKNALRAIRDREEEYASDKREKAEFNRRNRVKNKMSMVPPIPEDMRDWIFQTAAGGVDFAFYDKKSKKWSCTACGRTLSEKIWKRKDGEKKIRHNDDTICPNCKKVIQAKKRVGCIEVQTNVMLLQPVNEEYSVARHFDVKINWEGSERKVSLSEAVRITLNKLNGKPKLACDIYYNQNVKKWSWNEVMPYFDNKGNAANRRIQQGYLYPGKITETLENTCYSAWGVLFSQLGAAGKKLDYNRLMALQNDECMVRVVECLFKGRFNKLLKETCENISLWNCKYIGPLHKEEESIEEVFYIADRQRINRIRDVDGGEAILKWMRWSDQTGERISEETLTWLSDNDIEQNEIEFISKKMSLQKIMNYVKRQQSECYKGKTASAVLKQWADYIDMCQKLKKHTDDEMIYKPRELKRRHDEAVAEIAKREAELIADEYTRRFPGAEEVLKEIKPKFEYENEQYMIIVPERLVEIVAEGRALNHCAGGTDRYFDRIAQRETYICFMRKKEAPKVPYYTIEIEPGGTIRQHRGYLDEEPEIEMVKPFLREWQKALKKKLSKEDMEYAKTSAIKREENLAELRAKNNTRVLEGLMEDFMEAV